MTPPLARIPPPLRRPLAIAGTAIATGATLLAFALHAHQAAQDEHQALRQRLQQLAHNHQTLLARQADARQALAEWADLRQAGLLADTPSHRLAAQLAARPAAASSTALRLAPAPSHDTPESPFILVGIGVQGRLAHDGHLLNLLEELGALKLGLLVPLACRVERAADDGPPIDIDCRFAWVSLRRDT